ncbi:helix-turn-helix domain-containing protein [Streptomyces hygroscopicus]|uniref:helix-turn-helix domain-containing protein n=1 Tax=Streptomyces hygroscopicus TaxID=1912 RepID=UPI0038226549
MSEHQPTRYTIVGNHLTQHRELSLTAIGLGAHIQSLPDGAQVDIRTLAGKFPEGRDRIAAALRELERHGYLERVRERTPEGQIVTRTFSYNAPETTRARRRPGPPPAAWHQRPRPTPSRPHRPSSPRRPRRPYRSGFPRRRAHPPRRPTPRPTEPAPVPRRRCSQSYATTTPAYCCPSGTCAASPPR